MKIQEISTHKAIREGNEIHIIQKGLTIDEEVFSKDELLYKIPAGNEDDVFAIMERYEEDNRCNLAELNS